MEDMDNRRDPGTGPAGSEKKNIFKEIETDLDLSFFDRDKRRSKDGGSSRVRKGLRGRRKNEGPNWRLLLAVLGIAALVVLLAVLIVANLRAGSSEAETGSQGSAYDAEDASALAEQESEPEEQSTLLKSCDIPEINMLIQQYFDCRLSADVEGLYTIFGKAPDAAMDSLRSMLSAQAGWIQAYSNIDIQIAPGLDEGSRVAFVRYDLNFRRTDTDAPGIMYCYIERGSSGSYVIDESLESEKVEYLDKLLIEPEVEELITETDNELTNALNLDSDLALIYTAFMDGDIYEESSYDPNREPEVNLFTDPKDSVLVDIPESEAEPAADDAAGPEVMIEGEAGTEAAPQTETETSDQGAEAEPSV